MGSRGFPEAVAKFEAHPGHGGFIEVPQGEIAEADQGQHGSGYAERRNAIQGAASGAEPGAWCLFTSKTEYGLVFRMQRRGEVSASFGMYPQFEGVAGIHNPGGGGVHISSCLIQGLLIAENAG